MSISNTLSSINQTTKEATRLEKALLDETKKETDIAKKINSTKKSITKSTSASTVNTKLRQIERHENDLIKTLNKKTDIAKKIAQKREKLSSLNQKLQREQQEESKKAERAGKNS